MQLLTCSILSSFDEKERAGWFTLIVSLVFCDCKCSVALPHDAMGWSAVCVCGVS